MAFAVANLMLPTSKQLDEEEEERTPIMLDNSEGLIINYARCCHPIPGDAILGYLSPGKGMVIHLDSCKNLKDVRGDAAKCMPANWSGKVKGEFAAEFKVELSPERGIIASLASRISETGGTIEKINVDDRSVHNAVVTLSVGVHDRVHLAGIMRRIRNMGAVQRVYRVKS